VLLLLLSDIVAGFSVEAGWANIQGRASELGLELMDYLAGLLRVQYLACGRTISSETISVKQYSASMVFTLSAHNPGEERGIA
jgi:hypothetical protein